MARPLSVLVTGGTAGIGAEVAATLAEQGNRLLITGRNRERGESAARELRRAGAAQAEFLETDHSSLAATDDLAQRVKSRLDQLDVLIANAGAMPPGRIRTAEGLDLEVAVDVVGVAALTDALVPVMTAAPAARVVLVTSDAALHDLHGGPPAWDEDPWLGERGAPMRAYARAKRAKLALAAGLAVDLAAQDVVVHAASPGPAWTPMIRSLDRRMLDVPLPLWWLIRGVQRAGSPARAARSVLAAATDSRYATPTGLLVKGTRARPIPVSQEEADRVLALARTLADSARERHGTPGQE